MIKLNGSEVEFQTFPNGETRLIQGSVSAWRDAYNMIEFKYTSDSDLIKLMFLKKYLDSKQMKFVELTILYMPYSRMDRVEGQSAFTLKYISEFINDMNFLTVTVVEPHSDVTPALLNNCSAISVNEKILHYVMNQINFTEDDYVVFPDLTANKRYSKFVNSKTLTGLKNRDFQTGKIKDLQIVGDVSTKDFKAIMIDDLSSYGGTFLMTATKLKELGAKEIYLIVSHCEYSIFEGELFKSGLIKKVFTTDTILTENMSNNRIEVINIDKLF